MLHISKFNNSIANNSTTIQHCFLLPLSLELNTVQQLLPFIQPKGLIGQCLLFVE